MSMAEQIAKIHEQLLQDMQTITTTQELDALKVKVLGKKGELTALLRGMGQLAPEERPAAGQLINQAREQMTSLLDEKQAALKAVEKEAALKAEALDVTEPRDLPSMGSAHPLTLVLNELVDCFSGMGLV